MSSFVSLGFDIQICMYVAILANNNSLIDRYWYWVKLYIHTYSIYFVFTMPFYVYLINFD